MKKNRTKPVRVTPEKDIDKYPIFRGVAGHQLGPHTVEEIEDPEWYELVRASLTGEISDDTTEEV